MTKIRFSVWGQSLLELEEATARRLLKLVPPSHDPIQYDMEVYPCGDFYLGPTGDVATWAADVTATLTGDNP